MRAIVVILSVLDRPSSGNPLNCLSFFYMTHQFFSRWAQTLTIRKKRSFRNPPKIPGNFRHWICKNSTFCWFPCIYQSIRIVWTRNNFCYKAWVLSNVKKCLSRCSHPVGNFSGHLKPHSNSWIFWKWYFDSQMSLQKKLFENCCHVASNASKSFSTGRKHLLKHFFTLLKTQAL